MGLFYGQYLVNKDPVLFNLIKCREQMADVETVNFHTFPEVQEFLVSAFSREGIVFQSFQMIPDNSSAFLIKGTYKGNSIDIDADYKGHS